jgi:hypothetical protein
VNEIAGYLLRVALDLRPRRLMNGFEHLLYPLAANRTYGCRGDLIGFSRMVEPIRSEEHISFRDCPKTRQRADRLAKLR